MAKHDEDPSGYHEDMRWGDAFESAVRVVCPHCRMVLKDRHSRVPVVGTPAPEQAPVGFTFDLKDAFECLDDRSKSKVISYGLVILPNTSSRTLGTVKTVGELKKSIEGLDDGMEVILRVTTDGGDSIHLMSINSVAVESESASTEIAALLIDGYAGYVEVEVE